MRCLTLNMVTDTMTKMAATEDRYLAAPAMANVFVREICLFDLSKEYNTSEVDICRDLANKCVIVSVK